MAPTRIQSRMGASGAVELFIEHHTLAEKRECQHVQCTRTSSRIENAGARNRSQIGLCPDFRERPKGPPPRIPLSMDLLGLAWATRAWAARSQSRTSLFWA